MKVKNLLVELLVEELPPKALRNLGDAFGQLVFSQLQEQGLTQKESKSTVFATPRRLAVHITQVLEQATDKEVSTRLMPVQVGLDAQGKPTAALLKRLEGMGVGEAAVNSLKKVADGKNEMLFYDSIATGALLAQGLQKALDFAIDKLPIPKVMGYQLDDGWSTVHFVRPVHGLVALHGSEIIPISAFGLVSGRATNGHRFEAVKPVVEINDADSYVEQLEKEGAVIASFSKRQAMIQAQLNAVAQKAKGHVEVIQDDALLEEVTALVELPNVLLCEFEPEFLGVPQECLILTMKANQRYFPLVDKQGKLSNQFLIISNIHPKDPHAVIAGNERVVRPRLADAKFFYDQDREHTLASRTPEYARMVYHNQLGSLADRMTRVEKIASGIVAELNGASSSSLLEEVQTAVRLAKADLLTGMVGEFPELQGIMGGYYALHDGLSNEVAHAIEDHYKPRFSGDALPRNQIGVIAALADKLETLVGMFGIGNTPTGDKDPYALRRHALGVIRLLIEKNLCLPLDRLLKVAAGAFKAGETNVSSKYQDPTVAVAHFIYDRLAGQLHEQGYSTKEVSAVLELRPQQLDDVVKRLEAVKAFSALPEAPALAEANKRVGNILKRSDEKIEAKVDEALLQEEAERILLKALYQAQEKSATAFDKKDYIGSLQALAILKEPVDAFFKDVMVNAEDERLRRNRLGLLALMHQVMNRLADLACLA